MARPGWVAAALRSASALACACAAGAALTTAAPTAGATRATSAPAATTTCTARPVLPAYFYPGSSWNEAIATATGASTIVVNPNSGPGSSYDPNYAAVVAAARARGAELLGYVNTFYTGLPLAQLEAQVQDYRSWYGIDDVYLDDVPTAANEVSYYEAADAFVRAADPSAAIFLNPGTYPDPVYATLGDTVDVLENDYQTLLATTPPGWVSAFPPSTFAMQVSAVPATAVAHAVAVATADHVQYVYLSPQTPATALYEQVPSYWAAELATIGATCQGGTPAPGPAPGPGGVPSPGVSAGYRLAGADGGVFTFGDAGYFGSMGGTHLNAPIVGMAATPTGGGYWEVAADGGVFTFGDAGYFGSMGGTHLNAPIVGMAATPTGGGYWEVAADGGVFTFGRATFAGSMGGTHLNAPIVGVAAAPTGGGYWEVSADGGVFTFGRATFAGSMGGTHLNAPIVGAAAAPTGGGYWEVAADGGIFAFGRATFAGSMGGTHLNAPIVGVAAAPTGGGYWEVAADGGIFAFGAATYLGSMGDTHLARPVVAVDP